jgi:hypothetical protein
MSRAQPYYEIYVKTFNTDVVEKLGAVVSSSVTAALDHIYLVLVKVGEMGGSERARLHVYPNDRHETPIGTSDWVALAELEESGDDVMAAVRFDFSTQPNLIEGSTYHIAIETDNYARALDYYLGAKLDWPNTQHTQGRAGTAGAQMWLVGYHDDD